ncbi:Digeranylgeranylglycerophospholipid reductase [Rhynchospora pubera]|uniref:Geranylgeranyl diphosphate reductase, chloroplastic n=1 Tax=Rhynchospora pubera TaxID=906938 RepID=A0AAV8ES66_9POAL|nr:Digeranylgeranylglycerophospholipid reductase [Rhynchospora pubera]
MAMVSITSPLLLAHKTKITTCNSSHRRCRHTITASSRPLRAAVIGGGPAGASAAESLANANISTFLFERNPTGSKPCGGAIPLCMMEEFSLPHSLIDRHVSQFLLLSPSNLPSLFSRHLSADTHYIPMLRREVLDSFLRERAKEKGAVVVPGLMTGIKMPRSEKEPYVIQYISEGSTQTIEADVIVGADGANSRVAREIGAGEYATAIAFQERIRLPPSAMSYYTDLAEMYLGSDVSPDFYAWVFPKCDHVAVGTGTVSSKPSIKSLQASLHSRAGTKLAGGTVIRVEAHPIPEHPRPRRVIGRVALVGDAAGYVTKCSGEGIYFAAKSGRLCGEAIGKLWREEGKVTESGLKREYLKKWDDEFSGMFRFLDLLHKVFYKDDAGKEALAEMCADAYVQKRTFECYLDKKMVVGHPWEEMKLAWRTVGSMVRNRVLGREVERLRMLEANLSV